MTATATTSKIVPAGTNRAMSSATPGLAVQLLTAGSAACVADLITFPLDTAKVRLQVNRKCYWRTLIFSYYKYFDILIFWAIGLLFETTFT